MGKRNHKPLQFMATSNLFITESSCKQNPVSRWAIFHIFHTTTFWQLSWQNLLKQTTKAITCLHTHTGAWQWHSFVACFTGELKSILKSLCAIDTLFNLLDYRPTHNKETSLINIVTQIKSSTVKVGTKFAYLIFLKLFCTTTEILKSLDI